MEKNEIIDERYIIERMKQDETIDYIAIIVSSWHYLNALATIEYLRELGCVRKGIILACRHGQNGYIVDQHMWNRQDDRIEKHYAQLRFLPQWRETIKYLADRTKEKNKFYLLRSVGSSPELATELWNAGLHKNYISIVIDEGLAYYLRTTKGWLYESRSMNHSPFFLMKKVIKEWIYQCYTDLFLKRRKQLLYNTCFNKKGGQLDINRTCTDYLYNVLERLSDLYNYSDFTIYENKLVICTQVFHDMGQILNNADMVVIRQICDQAKRHNLGVVIKPHPREINLEKYMNTGAYVDINNSVPLEIMLAGLKKKPAAIIGITTTSLVTANVLWEINAFSIIRLVDKKNFCKDVLDDINNFPRIFSKYVTILKNVDEMFTYLLKGDTKYEEI